MSKKNVVIISHDQGDIEFFSKVAQKSGFSFCAVSDLTSVVSVLKAFPTSVVFWNADMNDPVTGKPQNAATGIPDALRRLVSPSRVCAVSKNPISQRPEYFQQGTFFQHLLLRRFKHPAEEVVSCLLSAMVVPYPTGLKRYFSSEASGHMITLKKSSQRLNAVESTAKYLEKRGVKSRISARVAQAVDELLMNAIFNAPHSSDGNPTRRMTPRDAEFDLPRDERVQLETIVDDDYVGICISDQFGSLDRDLVLRLMSKNYKKRDYTPKDNQPGAGLGVYGVIEMGFSLLFVCKAGYFTEAFLFFPLTSDFKSFLEGFQFISFLGDPTYRRGKGISKRLASD